MTTTVVRLQNALPLEEPEGDESEEPDISNANFGKQKTVCRKGKEFPVEKSSSAHTDSENEEGEKEDVTARKKNVPMNDPVIRVTPIDNSSKVIENMDFVNEDLVVGADGNDEENKNLEQVSLENCNLLLPKMASPQSTPRRNQIAKKKKPYVDIDSIYSSTDEDLIEKKCDGEPENKSYAQIKMGRKTLLKIEKLTDSDSRGRDQMRSRGLSPPSSSDEENLYIGWVAYPTGSSKTRINKTNGLKRQRVLCTCIEAFKYLVSPVTKVCKLCRNNKVWDSASVKDCLLEDSSNSDSNRKTK